MGPRRVGQVVAPDDARSNVAADNQVEHVADAGPRAVMVRHIVEHLPVGQQVLAGKYEDIHAGEIETSILLHAHLELVREGYHAADWVLASLVDSFASVLEVLQRG